MPSEINFPPISTAYQFESEVRKLEKVAQTIEKSPNYHLAFNPRTSEVTTALEKNKASAGLIDKYVSNMLQSYHNSSTEVRGQTHNIFTKNQLMRFFEALKKIEQHHHTVSPQLLDTIQDMSNIFEEYLANPQEKRESLIEKIKAAKFDAKAHGVNYDVLNTLSLDELNDLKKLTRLRSAKKTGSAGYKKFDHEINKLLKKEPYSINPEKKIRFRRQVEVKTSEGLDYLDTNLVFDPRSHEYRKTGKAGNRSINEQMKAMNIINKRKELSPLQQQLNVFSEKAQKIILNALYTGVRYSDAATNITLFLETKNVLYAFDKIVDALAPKYLDENGKFLKDFALPPQPDSPPPEELETVVSSDEKSDDDSSSLSSSSSTEPEAALLSAEMFLWDFKNAFYEELNKTRADNKEILETKDHTTRLVSDAAKQTIEKLFNLDGGESDMIYEEIFDSAF